MNQCVHAKICSNVKTGETVLTPIRIEDPNLLVLRFITIAYDSNYAAVSICNPLDLENEKVGFQKGTGRNIAYERLDTMMYNNQLKGKNPYQPVACKPFQCVPQHKMKTLVNSYLQPLRNRLNAPKLKTKTTRTAS